MITEKEIFDAAKKLIGPTESFVPVLQAESIVRRLCRTAKIIADRENRPVWSVVGELTGHGSGVSGAIVELYGGEA